MEEPAHINQILSSLRKYHNTGKLLPVLLELRKLVNVPNHKINIQHIKRSNCLKHLVSYTQYNANPKIVDISLSILGNCCTDTSIIKISVNDLNILHNLLRVLEKHDKDSIKTRVFRILGNLCDGCQPLEIIFSEPKIIENVTHFLKTFKIVPFDSSKRKQIDPKATTVSTVSMALRFIKKLIVRNTFDKLAIDYNLVNLIGILLIKCSNLWKDNKHDHGFHILVDDVLKIFQLISSSMFEYYNVIHKLTKTDEGNALESFVAIFKIDPLKLTKIILKLASQLKNQSDLPVKEIITNLINSINLNRNNEPSRTHYVYLECINKLMDHVGFRDKLKESNNIKNLINLLRELDTESDLSIQCSLFICSILYKCKYIEDLIKTQLDNDIINVIVIKLEAITGRSSEKIIVSHHELKPSKTNLDNEAKKMKTVTDDRFLNNYIHVNQIDRCVSPSSCSDVSSCGPYSPTTSNIMCHDDSDSDDYSPLCSENECEEDFKFATPEDESILSDCEQKKLVYNQGQLDLRNKFRDYMSSLIKLYCTMSSVDDSLGNPKLLTILLNILLNGALCGERSDSVFSLIVLIVKNKKFLLSLMSADVILQLIEVTDTKHDVCCSHCEALQSKADDVISEITTVAESDSVKGDIAHNLFKKNQDVVNQKLVLAVPYIIREQSTLRDLLKSCGGLDILIYLLKNEENKQLQKKAIKSICTLASDRININNPVKKEENNEELHLETLNGQYEFCSECHNVVTFKLDDGTIIQADRKELEKKSDYFSALLSGHFIESNQSEITLKNVLRKSFNCLLELLKLDIKPNVQFTFNYDLETILDLILLTDRFLLNDLTYSLVCHVEQLINVHNLPKFYKWSIESGTNFLRIESVAYALVSEISYCERLELFYSLFGLGYFSELVTDIELIIKQFL